MQRLFSFLGGRGLFGRMGLDGFGDLARGPEEAGYGRY
jgi:hypothetical protein